MDRERRKQYPPNWEAISRQFRESKGFTCEHCQVTQGTERISRRTGVEYPVVVAAAHKHSHDTANPHPELLCLCASCHWHYDYTQRQREQEMKLEQLRHRLLLIHKFATRRDSVGVASCRLRSLYRVSPRRAVASSPLVAAGRG